MHPMFEFEGLYYANAFVKIKTEEKCISFLEDLKLIPKKNEVPACPVCSGSMEVACQWKQETASWLWECSKETCLGSVNPLQNTFFEGIQLSLLDTLVIILNFTDKRDLFDAWHFVNFFEWTATEKNIGKEMVKHVYDKCKRVCQIVMSQEHERMIGPYISTLHLMYCKRTLNVPNMSRSRKASIFLEDVRGVYPGYGKNGLNYKHLSNVNDV